MSLSELEDFISIGELSKVTGITTHTLRMWEKRYGTPKAKRLPSGHRRYSKKDIPRLRAIVKALDSGYRASKVVTGTLEQLHSLMGLQPLVESTSIVNSTVQADSILKESVVESWMEHVCAYDDDLLINSLHAKWGEVGALSFVINYATPFLETIGTRWEEKELSISQEHFASECLVGFFSEKWRQMNVRKSGPCVLITTIPGDPYTLGILMCAIVTAITKLKVVYLGIDTPVNEVVRVVKKENPKLITFSISHSVSTEFSEDCLFKLRGEVEEKIHIVTGGKGSSCNIPGVEHIVDFSQYYSFLQSIIV